jgi:hypothetical protein
MWLCLSETHLKHHEKFFIQNYQLYRTDRFLGVKGRTATGVRKDIPHAHMHRPTSPCLLEAVGFFVPVGNSEGSLAAVHKSSGRVKSDALLSS